MLRLVLILCTATVVLSFGGSARAPSCNLDVLTVDLSNCQTVINKCADAGPMGTEKMDTEKMDADMFATTMCPCYKQALKCFETMLLSSNTNACKAVSPDNTNQVSSMITAAKSSVDQMCVSGVCSLVDIETCTSTMGDCTAKSGFFQNDSSDNVQPEMISKMCTCSKSYDVCLNRLGCTKENALYDNFMKDALGRMEQICTSGACSMVDMFTCVSTLQDCAAKLGISDSTDIQPEDTAKVCLCSKSYLECVNGLGCTKENQPAGFDDLMKDPISEIKDKCPN